MTVYVDVLFAVNTLMDYITLIAAARFGGLPCGRIRVLCASLLGGCYSVLALVWPPLGYLPLRVLFGVGLCLAAYGRSTYFVRACALFFTVAGAFVGIAAALGSITGRKLLLGAGYYFAVPMRALLLSAAIGYALSGVLLRGDAAHGAVRREIETLKIRFGNRTARISALRDNGNDLTEPLSGRSAVVLGRAAAGRLLDSRLLDGLTADSAASCLAKLPPEQAARFGLLPYRAVGTDGGMLLYFRPDEVRRADGTIVDCVIAVSPQEVGQGDYEGLIGV